MSGMPDVLFALLASRTASLIFGKGLDPEKLLDRIAKTLGRVEPIDFRGLDENVAATNLRSEVVSRWQRQALLPILLDPHAPDALRTVLAEGVLRKMNLEPGRVLRMETEHRIIGLVASDSPERSLARIFPLRVAYRRLLSPSPRPSSPSPARLASPRRLPNRQR